MTLKACATCGELTTSTYCEDHTRRDTRNARRDTGTAAWINLSRRARRLQPFCALCGTTESLAADHSPRAWARTNRRLTIRLCDITVLCTLCNNQAGSSQPGSDRYTNWQHNDGNITSTEPDQTLTTDRATHG